MIKFLTLDEIGRLLAYRHGLRASEIAPRTSTCARCA
jgi:hypothetical protein